MEPRSSHSKWWPESEQLLQIKPNTCASTDPTSMTMGVTPLILSRSIALRTLCRLQMLYVNWGLWRTFVGRMWTEYTLYYLTARCTHTFDTYHFHYTTSSLNSLGSVNLGGLSVWSYDDWTSLKRRQLFELVNAGLKWRRKEINEVDGQLIVDNSTTTHGLFSVLQGRQNINPNLFHQLLYPLFIEYLKQQHDTQQIVTIINRMSEQLIQR
ncbi:unnamed protein product [Rotaria sp. Silwood2]|nr:unnamed protein product [Rotaria sp. Silwood2]